MYSYYDADTRPNVYWRYDVEGFRRSGLLMVFMSKGKKGLQSFATLGVMTEAQAALHMVQRMRLVDSRVNFQRPRGW